MQTRLTNPYCAVSAVRNPDMFFGRTDLLRRFYSAIANHQSVSLVGSRHIGKSSFLKCVQSPEIQRRFEYDLSHYIFVFIDLRQYLQKTFDDFFEELSKLITAQSHGKVDLVSHPTTGTNIFCAILDQIKEQGLHPVLLIDSFEEITRNKDFDPAFLLFLRSQAEKVSYVTASITPPSDLPLKGIKGSPFFNIFDTYRLGPLTREEAYELATVPSQATDLPFTEDEATWVLSLAGQHPFFIQRVCYWLFETKRKCSEKGRYQLQQVRHQAYHDLKPFFEFVWDSLDRRTQKQLRDTIQQEEASKLQTEADSPGLNKSFLFRMFVCQKFGLTTAETSSAVDDLLRCLTPVAPLSDRRIQSFYSQTASDNRHNRYYPKGGVGHSRTNSRIHLGDPENHYAPTGWMGDYQDITMTQNCADDPHSGRTCIRVVYSGAASQGNGWAGVYWQDPVNNWRKAPGSIGHDLSNFSRLTFWVRGDRGCERIEFKVGGITGPYGDSLQPALSTGVLTLTTSWQLVTIELTGQDLTHIIGGFVWVANTTNNPNGATFYLDDISYFEAFDEEWKTSESGVGTHRGRCPHAHLPS